MGTPDRTALAALRQRAIDRLAPGDEIAFESDARLGEHQAPPVVYLAIARPGVACIVEVAASEWDGMAVAKLLGFDLGALDDAPAPPAPVTIDAARAARDRLREQAKRLKRAA